MNKTISDLYRITFSSPVNMDGLRAVSSVNEWLSQFIEDHYTIEEATRLLNGINSIIITNQTNGGYFPTQSLQIAVVDSLQTRIYEDMEEYENNNNITPSFTLPTSDFKEIVKAWKAYLQSFN